MKNNFAEWIKLWIRPSRPIFLSFLAQTFGLGFDASKPASSNMCAIGLGFEWRWPLSLCESSPARSQFAFVCLPSPYTLAIAPQMKGSFLVAVIEIVREWLKHPSSIDWSIHLSRSNLQRRISQGEKGNISDQLGGGGRRHQLLKTQPWHLASIECYSFYKKREFQSGSLLFSMRLG